MPNISKVYNANVYIDGTNNLLGRASEVTLPTVAATTEEHKALGMIGTVVLPTGLGKLEAGLKWSTFSKDIFLLGGNPFAARKLQLRANVETFGAGGRVDQKPLVVLMTASWTESPLGGYGAQTSTEVEQKLVATYVKVSIGGVDLVEIDVLNNVWKVEGVDILATYRTNIGA